MDAAWILQLIPQAFTELARAGALIVRGKVYLDEGHKLCSDILYKVNDSAIEPSIH